jgi:hypothetical protein
MNFSVVHFTLVVPVGVDTHRNSFLASEGWTLREVGNWIGISREDKPEMEETLVPQASVKKACVLRAEAKKK